MSSLLGIHSLTKSYGTHVLFTDITFTVCEGDRIGLLGPNGAGKSTLLKILMGLEPADGGKITKRQGLRLGYASQTPEFPPGSVDEVLGCSTEGRILLGKAQFTDIDQDAGLLSGGWKKRLDIVRALLNEPDLLLLDEPTNHLDLEGILWLEKFLKRERTPYIVISHDRYFLQNVTNKIIELNPCYPEGLFISEGNMTDFAEHKETFLLGQQEKQRALAGIVKDEVDWLRRSPKARTTKSQSRIQRANELINELSDVKRRNKTIKVDIEFSASERETRKLLTATNISKSLGGRTLFKGLNLVLSPGARLGIVGKNGTGKSTLLKILARMIPQDTGTIKYAEDLKLVYFDQHREHIALNISLREALAPNGDVVNYQGQSIHVHGWAQKFLFSPDRLGLPVGCLSGGERARILIARLMLEPADILFLDEPTNDLDIETLEVIEESLKEFVGAVVMISHDRCLMDQLCTQILVLGEEATPQFFADYTQWERSLSKQAPAAAPKKEVVAAAPVVAKAKKLSYMEQKELEKMPETILAAEKAIEDLQERLNEPDSYARLAKAQAHLEALFERWQRLENQ